MGTHEKLVLVVAFMVGTARQRREGSENLNFMTLFPVWIFYYMPVYACLEMWNTKNVGRISE